MHGKPYGVAHSESMGYGWQSQSQSQSQSQFFTYVCRWFKPSPKERNCRRADLALEAAP